MCMDGLIIFWFREFFFFIAGLCGFLPIHPRTLLESKRNRAAAAVKQAEAELAEERSDSTDADNELNSPPQSWFLFAIFSNIVFDWWLQVVGLSVQNHIAMNSKKYFIFRYLYGNVKSVNF